MSPHRSQRNHVISSRSVSSTMADRFRSGRKVVSPDAPPGGTLKSGATRWAAMADEAVSLIVREARTRDAGRGIARLPAPARQSLGVLSGDTVFVEGDRETAARVWPADDDLPTNGIRLDGETRANAGVTVGAPVSVRAESVPDAERVVVRPAIGRTGVDPEPVRRGLMDRPLAPGEQVRVETLGEGVEVTVVETSPSGTVLVTEETDVRINPPNEASESSTERRVGTTYEDIGGLDDELALVRELVELPLSEPDLFGRLGIEPPKGVLLYGPPGTGKTLIAKAVATEADATFHSVSGPEIVRAYKGESEERLREIFETATADAPAVLFFDELDSIAGPREGDADLETRLVAQLLSLMDGLEERGDVVVIGATNRVDAIDPALRRPGRFDREIEIGVPNEAGRREILAIHTRGMPLADDVDIDQLAERTHGFVGADLRAVTVEAAMNALRRHRDEDAFETLQVTQDDVESALGGTDPSAMRAFVAERPSTTFEDIGGLEDVKTALRETVEWPIAHPRLFEETGTDPPSGVLLYGPPGTGKTMLAAATAAEGGVNFLRVAGPELLDRYVGESEQSVRELFERARRAAPAVVFLDELDAIAGRRDYGEDGVTNRVVSQLLTELDRAANNPSLVVLAASNRKDALDPALLRPGRLERHLEVPPPDEAGRRAILELHTRDTPLADAVDLGTIAAAMEGATGAELAALVREATMRAIREAVDQEDPETAAASAEQIEVRPKHVRAAME